MKKFWYVGLLCVVVAFSVAATSGSNRTDDAEKSSAYLSSIRLSQVKRQFEEMPNEQAKVSQVTGDEVQPMTPLSANPASGCLLSACGGSGCLGSLCGGSGCLGSGCGGSACGKSACGGSACGTSGCGASACAGSLCGASACGGSLCGGSACIGSACAISYCYGSACMSSCANCDW